MGQFSTTMPSSEGVPGIQKTVLIVEDDAGIGELLVYLLSQETPYNVVLAEDGFAALELVKRASPSLFMLDYHLPGMTGIELADKLRDMQAYERVPIMIMSARLPVQEIQQRNLLGMNKPFDLMVLLKTIETLVGQN